MSATLVHPQEQKQVSAARLVHKCALFKDQSLLNAPYLVKSSVPVDIFRVFTSALEDEAIQLTAANFAGLLVLSAEFGFEALNSELLGFRSPSDAKPQTRLAALEERARLQDCKLALLRPKVSKLSASIDSLRRALESAESRLSGQAAAICQAQARAESAIRRLLSSLGDSTPAATQAKRPPPASVAPAAGFGSMIVPDFPPLFADFSRGRFALLWRGSRDSFRASAFHGTCDGHANTLTLIEDTKGNIFGGFTPVKWESASEFPKADPSLRSFLFTLRNPHSATPRKFELRPQMQELAIYCDYSLGPCFGGCPWEIAVSGDCNGNSTSSTNGFGAVYVNDTGMDGRIVFTGSRDFTVKEIEVFEIIF
jgi:hypothetical protein